MSWFLQALACRLCLRMARPAAADAHTYVCGTGTYPSTAANVVYFIPVIASDQTGEAEFTLYGGIGEQAIGHCILRVIRNNQPTEPSIINDAVAASQVRFPPPEVSVILGNRYRFVVSVNEASFTQRQTTFFVHKIEAVFPRVRRLSSADTVIPATSWDIDPPMVQPSPSAQISSTAEPGSSDQVNNIPDGPVLGNPTDTHINAALTSELGTSNPSAVSYTQIAADRKTISNIQTSPGCSTQTLQGNNYKPPMLDPAVTAFNRRKRKLELDGRRGIGFGASGQ